MHLFFASEKGGKWPDDGKWVVNGWEIGGKYVFPKNIILIKDKSIFFFALTPFFPV